MLPFKSGMHVPGNDFCGRKSELRLLHFAPMAIETQKHHISEHATPRRSNPDTAATSGWGKRGCEARQKSYHRPS